MNEDTATGHTTTGLAASAYRVLARKYRPTTFDGLIGQAMHHSPVGHHPQQTAGRVILPLQRNADAALLALNLHDIYNGFNGQAAGDVPHSAVMAQVQEKLMSNIQAMDPETIMRSWNSASMQGMEQLQQAFWNSLANMTGQTRK